MPTYKLFVTRVTEYEIEAASPDLVWDAYIELEEGPRGTDETTGHVVLDEADNEVERQGQAV